MSNITKRALAASLKKLLERAPLDKITIQDLVDDAEVSRKTFYYHFQDIYDLMEWCIVEDGKRILEGNVTAGPAQCARLPPGQPGHDPQRLPVRPAAGGYAEG